MNIINTNKYVDNLPMWYLLILLDIEVIFLQELEGPKYSNNWLSINLQAVKNPKLKIGLEI